MLPQTGATNVAAGGDSGDLGDFNREAYPCLALSLALNNRRVS